MLSQYGHFVYVLYNALYCCPCFKNRKLNHTRGVFKPHLHSSSPIALVKIVFMYLFLTFILSPISHNVILDGVQQNWTNRWMTVNISVEYFFLSLIYDQKRIAGEEGEKWEICVDNAGWKLHIWNVGVVWVPKQGNTIIKWSLTATNFCLQINDLVLSVPGCLH